MPAMCTIEMKVAGAITVPYGIKSKKNLKRVLVTEASHPIPDDSGIEGTVKFYHS